MKAIVSVDENWGIGLNGSLLVRIPEDMKFFKKTTVGGTVIMGRETFMSLPRSEPLPDRRNIVLTTRRDFFRENVLVCHTLEELFLILADIRSDDCFVIGGDSVYRQLIAYCDEAVVTKIHGRFEADRHFVNLDAASGWKVEKCEGPWLYNDIEYSRHYYRNENVSVWPIKNS